MGKKIKLQAFLNIDFLLDYAERLNGYIKNRLNKNERFSSEEISLLKMINKMLDDEEKNIKWFHGLNDLKANLELFLFRENENCDVFEAVRYFLQKQELTKDELLVAVQVIYDYKFLTRKFVKNTNIFDLIEIDFNSLNNIVDKNWLNGYVSNKVGLTISSYVNELNKILDKESDYASACDKFQKILIVLKNKHLKSNVVKNIILIMNKYKEKLDINNSNIEFLDVFNEIEHIVNTNALYSLTNKFINDEVKIDLGQTYFDTISYDADKLPFLIKQAPIISLDSTNSPDLDSAFSIRKDKDLYLFNVYVTDVPSFLSNNRELSINSYRQGTSFYIRDGDKNINYDMLPKVLSHDYLSMLKSKKPKNAICFQFVFNNDGKMEECKVSRNKVIVDANLFATDALKILKQKKQLTLVDKSIFMMQELTKKVANNSDKVNMRSLEAGTVNDMIAFPSVLVNLYLAEKLAFGMFYENSAYIMNPTKDTPYLRSSAPLRRYADDINLAIFLEQENLQRFNRDDFRYLEKNFEEIIEYLNKRNVIDRYIKYNNSFVKKLLLKKEVK